MVKIIKCSNCGEYKPHCANGVCRFCYQNIKIKNMRDKAPLKRCECSPDCKEMILSITNTGKTKRYAKGHHSIGRKPHNFKGYTIDKHGYILVYGPNHPYRDSNGYVREHRLVYERYLKILFDEDIYIPKDIDIHHINGNVQDNSLINLEALHKTIHRSISGKTREYKTIDKSDRYCNLCGSHKTKNRPKRFQRREGGKLWHLDIDGWLCHWCYEVIRDCRKKFGL